MLNILEFTTSSFIESCCGITSCRRSLSDRHDYSTVKFNISHKTSVYNNEWRSPFIVAATVNEDVTHRCHVISSVVGLRELISCCRRWRRLPVECHDLLFACQSRTSSSMHWLTALPVCRSRLNFSHPFLSSRVLQVFSSRTDTDLVHIRRGVTDTTLDKNSSLLSQCLLATDCWNMCIYFRSSDDRWDVLCFTAELLLPVDLSSPRPSSGDPSQYISGRVLNIARKTSSSIIPTPSYVLQFFQKKIRNMASVFDSSL